MKDLLEPNLAKDIKRRILCLDAQSEPRWGKMTVVQTLTHCTYGMQMAMGVINA